MRCNIICIHCVLCVLRETMCAGLQVLVVKTMGCNNRGLLAAMVGWPVVMLVFEEKCRDRWLGIISFDRRTPPGLFIYIYRGAPPIVIYLFFRAITTLSAMACLFIIIGVYAARRIIYVCFRFGHVVSRESCHMQVFLLRHSVHLFTSCSAPSLSHFPLSKSIFVQ